jgi:hypothetical protein
MNITAWILIGVVAGLIGYDLFAVAKWGYTGTISYDVLSASKNHPIIPFAIGIIAGHFFWSQPS